MDLKSKKEKVEQTFSQISEGKIKVILDHTKLLTQLHGQDFKELK